MRNPPALIQWLLSMAIHPSDRDEVVGDLAELFAFRVAKKGRANAVCWYTFQVLRSAPRFFLQSFFWKYVMLSNYLKLTIRTLFKQKLQGAINLASLTIGITLAILIMLFVRDEMTHDQFHTDHQNIFQIQNIRLEPDGSISSSNSNGPLPLGASLVNEIPGIKQFSRTWNDEYFIRNGTEIYKEDALFVDPSFLDIFTFPLLRGSSEVALVAKNSVVITESFATRLFGEENALGQSIEIRVGNEYQLFDVTGVIADPPTASSFQFTVLAPIDNWIQADFPQAEGQFGWSLVETFFQIEPTVDISSLDEPLDALYASHHGDYLKTLRERTEFPENVQPATYRPVALAQMYLQENSDPAYSYILSAIGLAILLIACINFMTLAIGRSLSRSREVGIRKSVGALRSQLIAQFWGESLFMTFLSTCAGLFLAWRALPVFNDITGKQLTLNLLEDWTIPLGIIGVIVFTGLVSGSYPAFVLSSFKPVDILKNKIRVSGSNVFTKGLVTLQFALSIGLIMGTLIMKSQMDFLKDQDRGFDTEQTLVLNLNGVNGEAAKRQLVQLKQDDSRIQNVSLASSSIGYRGTTGFVFNYEGERVSIDILRVDGEFLDALQIPVVQGRSFDANRPADSTGVAVVNQALVDRFGLKNPIGSQVPGIPAEDSPTIIGVTDNFKYQSLYQMVGPIMITQQAYDTYNYVYVVLSPGNFQEPIQRLEAAWKNISADVPFQFEFLDDRMARVYAKDARWSKIVNIASTFAVFLALIGLLGLTSLSVKSRTKEIGIRKVLGASPLRVYTLITKDFVLTILLGAVIATPAAYIFSEKWLANFAFKTPISLTFFILPIALVVGAALVTIVLQSFRTIQEDPVHALRTE